MVAKIAYNILDIRVARYRFEPEIAPAIMQNEAGKLGGGLSSLGVPCVSTQVGWPGGGATLPSHEIVQWHRLKN